MRTLGLVAGTAVGYAGVRALTRRRFDVNDKLALITGGSRGLGLQLARELGRRGARVVICARDADELGRAKRSLEADGVRVHTYVCDVSHQAQIAALVKRLETRFGGVDVLVNNAGIIQVGPVETMTPGDFERAMGVNFFGALYASLAVLGNMRAKGRGIIVNVTSIGGKVAVPHLLPYDCAKFAFVGLSEGLRAELTKDGIQVTTIIPGLMRTGSPVHALFKGQARREFEWFVLGDASAVTSMSAERAARKIVQAMVRGDVEITLSWQAKILRLVHDLFPSSTLQLMALANRFLPEAGDDPLTEGGAIDSSLQRLIDSAARRFNEKGELPSA